MTQKNGEEVETCFVAFIAKMIKKSFFYILNKIRK